MSSSKEEMCAPERRRKIGCPRSVWGRDGCLKVKIDMVIRQLHVVCKSQRGQPDIFGSLFVWYADLSIFPIARTVTPAGCAPPWKICKWVHASLCVEPTFGRDVDTMEPPEKKTRQLGLGSNKSFDTLWVVRRDRVKAARHIGHSCETRGKFLSTFRCARIQELKQRVVMTPASVPNLC